MFSDELKQKRKDAGLSLREASKVMRGSVSYVMLHRYERGQGLDGISLHHARAIAKLYGWELTDMAKKLARQVREGKVVRGLANLQEVSACE